MTRTIQCRVTRTRTTSGKASFVTETETTDMHRWKHFLLLQQHVLKDKEGRKKVRVFLKLPVEDKSCFLREPVRNKAASGSRRFKSDLHPHTEVNLSYRPK